MEYKIWNHYVVFSNGAVIGPSGRILKGTRNTKGYLQTQGPHKKKYLLHRIVAAAWYEFDITSDLQVDHLNGNKHDNAPANLRIVNRSEHVELDRERRVNAAINAIRSES